MKKIILGFIFICQFVIIQSQTDTLRLNLSDAIKIAQKQSVDAAVAINELKKAYWEYRTFKADQLPEINFTGTLPVYSNKYSKYQQPDGTYTYLQNKWLELTGKMSVNQNIPLTGGKISLNTSLDFTRQFGSKTYNEYMSIPISLTLEQPILGVNRHKWNKRIEPVRYKEAKAEYLESLEGVTLSTIDNFFNLLLAKENIAIALQNLANADKLYEVALAKREIGYISESELMQLNLSALQAKAIVTEAQSNLNANMFKLRAFLGINEFTYIEPLIPEYIFPIQMEFKLVLEKALENNSFVKNILRRQLEAEYAVDTAKGNQRSINLYASMGYRGKGNNFNNAYNSLNNNQVLEIGVNVPIIDWGKRKGKVKVAESNKEAFLSKIKQEEMNFKQNIFLLVENFNNQREQLNIAQQADKIAEKRYETSIETFIIGKISVLDLNDAQQSKDNAKIKYIQELCRYWNYYYNIRSITLYDFIDNRPLDAQFEEIIL